MKKIKYLILVTILTSVYSVSGQYFKNGDFSRWTSDWETCHEWSSPDQQPGEWWVEKEASKGRKFVTMVARGAGPGIGTTEDFSTELHSTLWPDNCYIMELDLSRSINFGHTVFALGFAEDTVWYTRPVKISIHGSNDLCGYDQLLWESPLIAHEEWETYQFSFVPDEAITFIELKVEFEDGAAPYGGNMCVDNLLIKRNDTLLVMDTTVSFQETILLEYEGPSNEVGMTWGNDEYDLCDACETNEIEVLQSGTVKATVLDEHLCKYYNIFEVYMQPYLPNVFTPNADGVNDVFQLLGLAEGELFIYNRWGELIFNNPTSAIWDGRTAAGEVVPDGTYFYQYNSLVQPVSGEITLLR